MPRRRCLALLIGGSLAACAGGGALPPSTRVGAPPAGLSLDPFYAKHVDAGGIAVVGSERVPDEALAAARRIVLGMLAARPDLRAELVRRGARVGVMAREETTTDLPEHRDWKKPEPDDPRLTPCERKTWAIYAPMSDREYWHARARGRGGLFTTVGAENLLAEPGSRYFGENILVHEFAHGVLDAIETADPVLYREVQRAYSAALAAGKWKGDYASVTLQEYWAEGTQFWFETNMLARLDEGPLLSREDLRRYDPALAASLGRAYGKGRRLPGDPFHRHPARENVPEGYKSAEC
jgi:hypothetical protein